MFLLSIKAVPNSWFPLHFQSKKVYLPVSSVPLLSHLTSCNPTKSNLHINSSFKTVVSNPALYSLLTFHVPNHIFITLVYQWEKLKVTKSNSIIMGHAAAQWLRYYKPEGHGFKTWWSNWILLIYLIFPATLGPGLYSASNRNEYQRQQKNVSEEQRVASEWGWKHHHFYNSVKVRGFYYIHSCKEITLDMSNNNNFT
jgi:hypothetical protein